MGKPDSQKTGEPAVRLSGFLAFWIVHLCVLQWHTSDILHIIYRDEGVKMGKGICENIAQDITEVRID